MNELKILANQVEAMTKLDFDETPNARVMHALIKELVYAMYYSIDFASKIVYRMKIDIMSFDDKNPDWIRIIENYAIMIDKVYEMSGQDEETMFVLAQSLSLKYNY